MNKIKHYAEAIDEELDGAKEYIETALEYKVRGDSQRYSKYKEMSAQELAHANNLHEFAVQDIDELQRVITDVPQEMLDKWEHSHKLFVEKAAWIRQMHNI